MRYYWSIIGMGICLMWLGLMPTQAQFVPPRILKHPGNIRIKGETILNSRYRETNLSISPDGRYLFFMSGRGQQVWSTPFYTTYKGHPEFDGDIWYSTRDANGRWQAPVCVSASVNTAMGEDEPNISTDGQRVYFQSWRADWSRSMGPYYAAQLNGTQWGTPVGLGGGITRFFVDSQTKTPTRIAYATDGATISPDGNIFIVAAGPDYQGEMDLYISRKDARGVWSYLKRLTISSIGNERAPFIAADNKTLYFASDGYAGWGGLDILKTTLNDDDSCGEVINIGAPFNTVNDDYGLIMPASGEEAFFVRDGDIYSADIREANPDMKPQTILMVKGKITLDRTRRGTEALVSIRHPSSNALIVQCVSNAATGEYAVLVPIEYANFIHEVSKQGYPEVTQQHKVVLKTGFNLVEADVALSLTPPDKPKLLEDEGAAETGN